MSAGPTPVPPRNLARSHDHGELEGGVGVDIGADVGATLFCVKILAGPRAGEPEIPPGCRDAGPVAVMVTANFKVLSAESMYRPSFLITALF